MTDPCDRPMARGLKGFSRGVRQWLPLILWLGLGAVVTLDPGAAELLRGMGQQILLALFPGAGSEDLRAVNSGLRQLGQLLGYLVLALLAWPAWLSFPRFTRFSTRAEVSGLVLLTALGVAVVDHVLLSPPAASTDLWIRICGSIAGLATGAAFIRFQDPTPNISVAEFPLPTTRVRVLITSDLHLQLESHPGARTTTALEQLRLAVDTHQPDVCLIVGDLGPADQADRWLELVSRSCPGARIVTCLGDQDHWLPRERWNFFPSAQAVREQIWAPACEKAGVSCLDFANFRAGRLIITGGYGHYDFGMRDPTLERDATFDPDAYERGEFEGLRWNSAQHIPGGAGGVGEEAFAQAEGIRNRLEDAVKTGRTVLVATHTVPFRELVKPALPGSPERFLDAYAGNSQVGNHLAACADRIQLAVCGHTHVRVGPRRIRGVNCLNVGSTYGALRFVLFDSETTGILLPRGYEE